MSNKTYYFVSGYTAKGSVNYLQTNIEHIGQVLILKHPSSKLKTQILKELISHYESNNHVEVICSPFGKEFLEGLIIRERSIAIVTNTIAIGKYPQAKEIDIQSYFGHKEINAAPLLKQIEKHMNSAYEAFSTGLEIHDHLEEIYIKEMDFNKADELADDFINALLKDVPKQKREPVIYRRLFGTNTKDGAVNVVPNLIEDINSRYYIKGRAGTGKSVFMNKVAQACLNYGLHIELYHCSFDPNSIDMVLIPELDACLFDSTDPHEFTPESSKDIVIDLYEKTVTKGTDEKYALKIAEVTKKYKTYMVKGIESVVKAGVYKNQLEEKYSENWNEENIEPIMRFIYKAAKL